MPVGGDKGHVEKLGERHSLGTGVGVDNATTCQEDGPLRLRQKGGGALDGPWVALNAVLHGPVGLWRHDLCCVDALAVEEIAWNIQKDRPLLAGQGGAEGIVQHLGNAFRLVDLQGQLGNGLEESHQVKGLAAVTIDVVARHVAGNDQHRRPALIGQGDAGEQVDRPRS